MAIVPPSGARKPRPVLASLNWGDSDSSLPSPCEKLPGVYSAENSKEKRVLVATPRGKNSFALTIDKLNRVGAGSFGTVFPAEDEKGNSRAVKIIYYRGDLSSQEVAIHTQLSHKYIVGCYGSFRGLNAESGLVMDFVRGGTLGSTNGSFTDSELKKLLIQVCEAVAYLHEHNIVHRDLKEENILYDAEKRETRVADFGLAIDLGATEDPSNLPECGSRLYMAPEVTDRELREREGFGRPVDVFSLGVIFYRSVASLAKHPIVPDLKEKNSLSLDIFMSQGKYIPDAVLSEKFEALTMRMLAQRPSARPTIHEVLAELRDISKLSSEVAALPR